MKLTGVSFHLGHKSGRRALSRIISVALELAIVFVGVYAAFDLSQYETRKRTAERRHELQDALVQEIGDLTSNTRRVAKQLPLQLQQFDSARRAGLRPALRPWIEPVHRQPYMWQLTVQSRALETFDVPTVYRLSRFYNELEAGFNQIAQLRSLSQSADSQPRAREQRVLRARWPYPPSQVRMVPRGIGTTGGAGRQYHRARR